jgi:hypothetical protein
MNNLIKKNQSNRRSPDDPNLFFIGETAAEKLQQMNTLYPTLAPAPPLPHIDPLPQMKPPDLPPRLPPAQSAPAVTSHAPSHSTPTSSSSSSSSGTYRPQTQSPAQAQPQKVQSVKNVSALKGTCFTWGQRDF